MAPNSRRIPTKKPERVPGEATQARSGDWVTLASLVRPQGRHGALLAEILTDFPERFNERRRLFLQSPAHPSQQPREVALEEHRLHQGRLLLKFAGVDSIQAAEMLRGLDVVIPPAERAPLEEGAVYISDLAGCLFYDRASATLIGEITGVDRESSNLPLIVVRSSSAAPGLELLIPFANAYQPRIDLAGRRMEMTLPQGLLSLGAPLTQEERAAPNETRPAAAPAAAAAANPPPARTKRKAPPKKRS